MSTHSLDQFLLDAELCGEPSPEHIKSWLEYKAGNSIPDPDSSEESRHFYKSTWKDLLNELGMQIRPDREKFSGEPSKYVQGDWMCSVWTTMKTGLQIAYGKDEEGDYLWLQKDHIKDTFKGSSATDASEETYKGILEHFDEFSEVFGKELQNFIRNAYTPANLIIVPDGFNSARSLGTQDYWDKTLHQYFEQSKPLSYRTSYDVGTPFYRLVKTSIEDNDALFLSDWLDKNGKAIMLPTKEPATLEEWCGLLDEMTRRINSRRDRMQDRHIASQHK